MYRGLFNSKAMKTALKDGAVLICRIDEGDGGLFNIYVTNGFIACRMSKYDYDEIVRPVAMRDPGNWSIDRKTGNATARECDIIAIFDSATRENAGEEEAAGCPLLIPSKGNKATLKAYYNIGRGVMAFYNATYADIVENGTLKMLREYGPAIIYSPRDDIRPLAVVLPVRFMGVTGWGDIERTKKAVRAYFGVMEATTGTRIAAGV